MWSGGFELDSPGDMFIKIRWALSPFPSRLAYLQRPRHPAIPAYTYMQVPLGTKAGLDLSSWHPTCTPPPAAAAVCRHRDRGVTMLVRVDVATSAASGVLRVTLSHHPAGFAPYRIDNCSLETLHARQYK